MVNQTDASSRSVIKLTKSFRHPIGEIERPFAAVHQGCPRAQSAYCTRVIHPCKMKAFRAFQPAHLVSFHPSTVDEKLFLPTGHIQDD